MFEKQRAKIEIGNPADLIFPSDVIAKNEPFDVIVDNCRDKYIIRRLVPILFGPSLHVMGSISLMTIIAAMGWALVATIGKKI